MREDAFALGVKFASEVMSRPEMRQAMTKMALLLQHAMPVEKAAAAPAVLVPEAKPKPVVAPVAPLPTEKAPAAAPKPEVEDQSLP